MLFDEKSTQFEELKEEVGSHVKQLMDSRKTISDLKLDTSRLEAERNEKEKISQSKNYSLYYCLCLGLKAEKLDLEQKVSALEAESHVNGLLKQELGFLE